MPNRTCATIFIVLLTGISGEILAQPTVAEDMTLEALAQDLAATQQQLEQTQRELALMRDADRWQLRDPDMVTESPFRFAGYGGSRRMR